MRQEILLELADAAHLAGSSLAKCHELCQELCERYFQYAGEANATDKEQQGFIQWEYRHYALYAHIMQDYILQAEAGVASMAETLRDCLNQAG